MFPMTLNRKSLAVKLVLVLVLCTFFAVSWHVFAAEHSGHMHLTEQCQICHWLQTVVWLTVSAISLHTWCVYERISVFSFLLIPLFALQNPSGRSPPRR